MSKKIVARNIYKIFGPHPEKAFDLIKQGYGREDILKKTGCTVGVNDASFEVEEGETFVIMGLSGSGKSTLIRCVNRLIEATRGELLIDGRNILTANEQELIKIRRSKISMVFQHFALFPHRTVLSNVQYGLEVQGVPAEERKKRAVDALNLVGLESWADSYPDNLSGGMQQRVGLARALANDPDILLMDEAFSALDPLIRKEMQDELIDLQSRMKKTILFITHDLDEALKLGDRIAVMKDGEIVQIGTSEDILTNPANSYVADFVQDVDRSKVLTAGSIMKKPDVVISSKEGPKAALRKMKEMGLSSVFVVGNDRRLEGLLTADTLVEDGNLQKRDVRGLLQTDIPKTSPDTPVRDLLPVAVSTRVPISVVDENDRLLGIATRISILAAMAGEEIE